jgi:hypothetical protein
LAGFFFGFTGKTKMATGRWPDLSLFFFFLGSPEKSPEMAVGGGVCSPEVAVGDGGWRHLVY